MPLCVVLELVRFLFTFGILREVRCNLDASVDWNHPVPVALAAMARRIALRVTQGSTSGNPEDGRAQSHRSTRVGVEGTRIGRSKAV